MTIPQEAIEALLLTQPDGLLELMLRMGKHLRTEVHALFPTCTLTEQLAVCDMVTIMMQESVEQARLELERTDEGRP